jgi:hypothetical protein
VDGQEEVVVEPRADEVGKGDDEPPGGVADQEGQCELAQDDRCYLQKWELKSV